MLSDVLGLFGRARTVVLDDLRSDRVLRFVLVLSFLLSAFWFWWRIPNFASADEYGRLLRPMKAAGYFLAEPGFDSLRRGATEGVASDASFYLYGILLLPVFLGILLTGQLGTFAGFAGIESRFTLWHSVPAWYWTATLLIARFVNVLLVLGIVYTTYRIGTILRDRRAGQLSAAFTSLSLAVISTAHEANEDTPMVFLLLVVLYLSIRYAQGADDRYFLAGSGLGGLAIAFKLTGGVVVAFLGVAYLLRHVDTASPSRIRWRPKLLIAGLLLGFVAIYVGIPNLFLTGPAWFIERYQLAFTKKATGTVGTDNPIGYAALLAYLNGLGLPLAIAAAGGVIASLRRALDERRNLSGELILFVGIAIYLVVFVALWNDFKTHHVLPSIPLLTIALGITFSWILNTGGRAVRIALAVLLTTTAVYAGAGTYLYATDPRDQAADWLKSEAATNATVTTYAHSVAQIGVIHGRPTEHYDFLEEPRVGNIVKNETAYTEWILSTPERKPDYILTTGGVRGSSKYPRRAAFSNRLHNGDHFGYNISAEFGHPPEERDRIESILRAGVIPRIEKRSSYQVIFSTDPPTVAVGNN